MPRKLCQSIHYYVNYHQFERLENPVAGGYKYLRETQRSRTFHRVGLFGDKKIKEMKNPRVHRSVNVN